MKAIKKLTTITLLVCLFALSGTALIADSAKATSNVPQITRDLNVGANGDDVKNLQLFLNANGYKVSASGAGSPGKETNLFGNATKAALVKFQAANKISENGFGSKTRALLASLKAAIAAAAKTNSTTTSTNSAANEIDSLKKQISSLQSAISDLQKQIATLQTQYTSLSASITANTNSGDSGAPSISSIKIANGGNEGYIDTDDSIAITFSEAIDPDSINSALIKGGSVSSVSYSKVGGIAVSSAGLITVKGIATFDMGTVSDSGTFTVKLALSSSGKILTITLTNGSDIEISNENFSSASQIGGSIGAVEDLSGNAMENGLSLSAPTGTFGGNSGNSDDSDGPIINSIKITNGGDDGYVDIGDYVTVTFNEAVNPESINSDLAKGDSVSSVSYSSVGGINLSSSGLITIKGIATFDLGSVETSRTFTSKIAMNSTGKILTITITGGSDVEITNESFGSATQIGGSIEDANGNEMEADSSINTPSGTFGGEYSGGSNGSSLSGSPYISSIKVTNGGDSDYVDTGDTIAITFSESIDPESINSDLDEGSYVTGVLSEEVGGVSVSSSGSLTVNEITTFDVGTVSNSGNFPVKLALNSTGKVLTITVTSGSAVEITNDDFNSTSQISGTVEDLGGTEMAGDLSIDEPTGNF